MADEQGEIARLQAEVDRLQRELYESMQREQQAYAITFEAINDVQRIRAVGAELHDIALALIEEAERYLTRQSHDEESMAELRVVRKRIDQLLGTPQSRTPRGDLALQDYEERKQRNPKTTLKQVAADWGLDESYLRKRRSEKRADQKQHP